MRPNMIRHAVVTTRIRPLPKVEIKHALEGFTTSRLVGVKVADGFKHGGSWFRTFCLLTK